MNFQQIDVMLKANTQHMRRYIYIYMYMNMYTYIYVYIYDMHGYDVFVLSDVI